MSDVQTLLTLNFLKAMIRLVSMFVANLTMPTIDSAMIEFSTLSTRSGVTVIGKMTFFTTPFTWDIQTIVISMTIFPTSFTMPAFVATMSYFPTHFTFDCATKLSDVSFNATFCARLGRVAFFGTMTVLLAVLAIWGLTKGKFMSCKPALSTLSSRMSIVVVIRAHVRLFNEVDILPHLEK